MQPGARAFHRFELPGDDEHGQRACGRLRRPVEGRAEREPVETGQHHVGDDGVEVSPRLVGGTHPQPDRHTIAFVVELRQGAEGRCEAGRERAGR